jgi:signal transduction histidine kinase
MDLVRLYQQQYPNPTPVIQEQTEAIDFDFLVEDLPKTLSSMKIGAERIGQLVLSLRNFSRLDEAEIKLVNLHEGIENTLFILNHQLKQGIQVVKQYGDLPLVECYPAQLNQVFINILQNAIDALQEEADRPNKQIVIKTETIAPNQIRVSIQDKGPGIPPEIKDKIFEPFFTTKEVGKGTGLGLSICYQIINKHQGQIEVNSQVGQGTEFVISFATARSAIALPIQQSYSPLIPTSGHLFISTYLSP